MAILGMNSKVIDKIVARLGLQTAVDKLPVDLVPTIQPVLEVTPVEDIDVISSQSIIATGNITLFTTPTDRDFYLTHAALSNQSDATADNTLISLVVTLATGVGDELIRMDKLTLTAFSNTIALAFPRPIKLKMGSTISFGSTFGVGASSTSATITGFLVDEL